jgi:HSP20 family protein
MIKLALVFIYKYYIVVMRKNKQTVLQKAVPFWNMPSVENLWSFDNFDMDSEKFFNHLHMRPTFFPDTISISCDIEDLGKEILVKVDLPGVTKKDIKLDISEHSIEISAKHKDESKKSKKNFLKKERIEVSYYRVLPLPVKVLSGKAKARLADGILSITMPKANPTKRKKNSITVE